MTIRSLGWFGGHGTWSEVGLDELGGLFQS